VSTFFLSAGGFLTQAAPVTEWWQTPAERYSVVIDFSQYAGRNITLHNSGPVELGLPWSCPPNCEPDFNTVGNKKKMDTPAADWGRGRKEIEWPLRRQRETEI